MMILVKLILFFVLSASKAAAALVEPDKLEDTGAKDGDAPSHS